MKKYFSGIIALSFALFLVAFTNQNSNGKLDQTVWTYSGPSQQTQTQLDNPENYDTSPPSCGGDTKICTITAPDDGNGFPVINVTQNGHVTTSNQFYSPVLKD